jgi:hypothetical protein
VPRTTAGLVQQVLSPAGDYDRESDLTPYIATANSIVERLKLYAANAQPTIPVMDDQLELVERWLAAHFYAIVDRPFASRSAGGSSGSFDGKTGMNFDATLYGQSAKMIDPTGFLAGIESGGGQGSGQGPPRVRVVWAGTDGG